MSAESDEERRKRLAQRVLFDGVAELYDATRESYPAELVDAMVATAGVAPGDRVLEVGCGTGQLTRQLAGRGFDVLAIDIGAALVATARRHLAADDDVRLETTSFEALDVRPQSLQLIVSATAYHWVDPGVRWAKPARLLRPGGWLALLGTREIYDEPFGSALRDVWIRYADDGGAFATNPKPGLPQELAETELFGEIVAKTVLTPRSLAPDAVFDLEQTRATVLHYRDDVRDAFNRDLRALVRDLPEVPLRQETLLLMAPVVARSA